MECEGKVTGAWCSTLKMSTGYGAQGELKTSGKTSEGHPIQNPAWRRADLNLGPGSLRTTSHSCISKRRDFINDCTSILFVVLCRNPAVINTSEIIFPGVHILTLTHILERTICPTNFLTNKLPIIRSRLSLLHVIIQKWGRKICQ